MATENKSGLNNILKSVLSINNAEQTFYYPPKIYTYQRNVVESLLLSSLVKAYPANNEIIDQINPFVIVETISITNGYAQLPENYRNILGSPMCFANPNSTGECGEVQQPLTAQNFKTGVLKSGCRLNPVVIVPQSEFAYRTTSTYDFPTWDAPIGMFVGKNQIKVCPYDITRVSVMYVMKERVVNYGYITQPDDTYLYDESTTIETQFDSNAFESIFNAMVALYGAYSRDRDMQNWSVMLKEKGIL